MSKSVKLILTDTFYNIFEILTNTLSKNALDITKKGMVFCEDKITLMTERHICDKFGGSFNIDVNTFTNYLRKHKSFDRVLSKEGSSMAIKKILLNTPLTCFSSSRKNLAYSLFELIIQLKSAKITPLDMQNARDGAVGVLKNKLTDIAEIYSLYEEFLHDEGYIDQSAVLGMLPEVIAYDEKIKDTDIFIIGYTSWTKQARSVIETIIDNAKSVTFILTEGGNSELYVNETPQVVRNLCSERAVDFTETFVKTDQTVEGKRILDGLFNPLALDKRINSDKISLNYAVNPRVEIEYIASTIKRLVLNGYRYRDMTIALENTKGYSDYIKATFELFEIPYFLDEKLKAENHPLVTLILAYINIFIKNFKRENVLEFIKNPLCFLDKSVSDRFENYLISYNVDYSRFFEQFTFGDEASEFEKIRVQFLSLFSSFDIRNMLDKLNVKEKLETLSKQLEGVGEYSSSAITLQVYDKVLGVIDEINSIIGGENLNKSEYKSIFVSGISAMELSIIPQFNDAVYIGGFKESSLSCAKHLFVVDLTGDIPHYSPDVALLSDGDISALEDIKIAVEPKIQAVNHREREWVGLGLSAFSEKLYLSYTVTDYSGKEKGKSEALSYLEKIFEFKPQNAKGQIENYITFKQGLNAFAKDCGEFADGKSIDFINATAFYAGNKEDRVLEILDGANRELKIRLDDNRQLIDKTASPTLIEKFNKCPYRCFYEHYLRVKKRDNGQADGLNIGTISHAVYDEYIKGMERVVDRESSDMLVDEILNKLFMQEEYSRLLIDSSSKYFLKRLTIEIKNYCFTIYEQTLNSEFKPLRAEIEIGKDENYPPINLLGGKVKLTGKIDRVDTYKDYFRIIDYKTGHYDDSLKALFSGTGLQLYLYACAIKDKIPAGLYYYPISNEFKSEDKEKIYSSGRTLNEKDIVLAQDKTVLQTGVGKFVPAKIDKNGELKVKGLTKEQMSACLKYSVLVSEKAVENMLSGVIVPSPEGSNCTYCDFKGICDGALVVNRKIGKVDENTVEIAVAQTVDKENENE